ncbi:heat shock 70 kDa protein 12A-like [Liolophura sinensis]|uniref:heat shock 70 kDa protein 12A-like n=1 Tax=Liolophura sinensis TaxID=3198878 RepID=UPI0031592024
MAQSKPLLVVAIDMGTTYSGYAFSFQHEFLADKLKITTNKVWQDGYNQLHTSYKTPTSVLIDPEWQFHSFGYEAEAKYSELARASKQKQWLLFRRFKMTLYTRKISESMELESLSGQRFNALSVFAMSIRYLKEHLSQSLPQQVADSEIQYVITVPAIWDEDAKQFMRKAAVQAGISPQRLTLALEPEAASVLFRVLSSRNSYEFNGADISEPGSRYIVVDAGGGTVDTTVHEVMTSGKLKELHKASGGDWGGTQVDDQFTELLLEIFTIKVMKEFGKTHQSDWLELEKEFEINKRKVSGNDLQVSSFRLPASLREAFSLYNTCSLEQHVSNSRFAGLVRFIGDKMRINGKVMQDLMKPTIQKIVSHVETLMADPKCSGISHILLVGGFSDSPFLQEIFRKNFPTVMVVTPLDAVLSVMKGAVIFGHHPGVVCVRLAKCTYGMRYWPFFNDAVHDKDKMHIVDGQRYCRDVFKTFIAEGEEVPCYKESSEEIFTPVYSDQKTMSLPVYMSTERAPKYITDHSCRQLGKFTVTLPTLIGRSARDVGVRFVFGETSLRVKAEEKATGNITEATFGFQ